MDDRDTIRGLHEAWIAAEVAGRVEDVLALAAPDVVMQPPLGEAIVGREAVRALLAASAGAILRIETRDLAVEVADTIAVKRARFETWLRDATEPVTGTHLWVLRPRWEVAFVTWSLDRPPADG